MYTPAQLSSVTTSTTPTETMFNPHTIETTELDNLLFTIVDVETTGGKPLFHNIIEIGIVQMRNGEILDTYETFINPGTQIPSDITMITGITDSDVEGAPIFPDITSRIMPYLTQGIFVAHNVQFDYNFIQKSLFRSGINWHAPKLCTVQLSRKLLPQLPRHNLDAIAQFFHIDIARRHRALDDAVATGKALWQMCSILKDQGLRHLQAISNLTRPPEPEKARALKPILDKIPYTPGVYLMQDKDHNIIYIGKSKCLHKRVRSYFYDQQDKSRKLKRLVEEVQHIDYIQTGSELSALLLESQKIKEHLPIFNTMIRNYKAYPFLKFTNEAYPRLILTREVKNDGATYYGPFKSRLEVDKLIEQLQKTFGIRTCKIRLNPKRPDTFKPCLDVALGNCSGACTGKLAVTDYAEFIKKAQNFLEGNSHSLIEKIESQIDNAAKQLEFEKAAELRDKLIILERLHYNRAKVAQAVHHNNLVILQQGINDKTKEAFLIKNGALVKTIQLKKIGGHNEEFEDIESQEPTDARTNANEWTTLLTQIYTSDQFPKITRENIDELMIIATWLMGHTSQKDIHFINTPESITYISEILAECYVIKQAEPSKPTLLLSSLPSSFQYSLPLQ